MPNLRKAPNEKVSAYRRFVTLDAPTGKRIEQIAKREKRSVAATLRMMVERGLEVAA